MEANGIATLAELPAGQQKALRFICQYKGVYANDIGHHVRRDATERGASSMGAQVAWELIRRGLAERKLQIDRRYGYFSTAAGRRLVKNAPE